MSSPEIVKTEIEQAKPKRMRKSNPEPEVTLGSWATTNPQDSVTRGIAIANALAPIINQQKLYAIISNKRGEKLKYVRCEGWTTMGAMLGVFPVEDYCRQLADGRGFEAKINLVRSRDGMVIGAASAECTHDESNWRDRDSYSLRSMALTRATSKAFRLSFSWIIKLAGFEPTPAEEMQGQEDAPLIRGQVEKEIQRQEAEGKSHSKPAAPTCLFYTEPHEHNGHFAEFLNLKEYSSGLDEGAQDGLRNLFRPYIARITKADTVLVSTAKDKLGALLQKLAGDAGITVKKLEARG